MINKLRQEVKKAMIAKDSVTKNALKNVINKATLEAKDNQTEITNKITTSALMKEIKQLSQTMDMLKDNNKTDSELYKVSERQKNYLETYLPKQMSEEEIREEVKSIISKNNITNMGILMKEVMASLKGKADNKVISQIAKEEFNKLSK